MYHFYCESVASEPEKLVTEKYYRDILHTDFPNQGFHKPKKDECNYCFSFNNMNDEEKAQQRNDFDKRNKRKWQVRQLKADRKDLARNDPDLVAATFDLEQVLLCPKLAVSSLFIEKSW